MTEHDRVRRACVFGGAAHLLERLRGVSPKLTGYRRGNSHWPWWPPSPVTFWIVSVAQGDVDVDGLLILKARELSDDYLYRLKSSISQYDLKINKQAVIDGVLTSLCLAQIATQLVCSGLDEGGE